MLTKIVIAGAQKTDRGVDIVWFKKQETNSMPPQTISSEYNSGIFNSEDDLIDMPQEVIEAYQEHK